MTHSKPIVGYYRVSTAKQAVSGLGLEAQHKALRDYSRMSGGRVLRSYTEQESGKNADRPELRKAIAHARRSNATLVIGKLDRLSRNAAFLMALQDAGVDFAACDNPHANKLTIRILAVVAQDETERISQRTKEALSAYKARGGLLGASLPECRNLTPAARRKGQKAASETHKRQADEAYTDLIPTMLEWREEGWTQQEIADELNDQGHTTRRGKPWSQVQVARVLRRAGSK
jgi:DNA invertase Pin-like site-specific DNA recombinase